MDSRGHLKFSSLFPCDTKEVKIRFQQACEKLGINNLRGSCEVKANYQALLIRNYTETEGPENSLIVDVRGDGNCLLYALLAPLLGFIPDKVIFYLQAYIYFIFYFTFRLLL